MRLSPNHYWRIEKNERDGNGWVQSMWGIGRWPTRRSAQGWMAMCMTKGQALYRVRKIRRGRRS